MYSLPSVFSVLCLICVLLLFFSIVATNLFSGKFSSHVFLPFLLLYIVCNLIKHLKTTKLSLWFCFILKIKQSLIVCKGCLTKFEDISHSSIFQSNQFFCRIIDWECNSWLAVKAERFNSQISIGFNAIPAAQIVTMWLALFLYNNLSYVLILHGWVTLVFSNLCYVLFCLYFIIRR